MDLIKKIKAAEAQAQQTMQMEQVKAQQDLESKAKLEIIKNQGGQRGRK